MKLFKKIHTTISINITGMAFEVKLTGNSEGMFSRQIVQKGLSNIYIYDYVLYTVNRYGYIHINPI
jgi:hypothetical protein